MMNMMKKDFSMGSIAVNMIVNMEMMKNLIGLLPKNLQKVAKWGMALRNGSHYTQKNAALH